MLPRRAGNPGHRAWDGLGPTRQLTALRLIRFSGFSGLNTVCASSFARACVRGHAQCWRLRDVITTERRG